MFRPLPPLICGAYCALFVESELKSEADARDGRREVGELATVQRQPFDARQIDDLADGRRACRDERGGGGDRDGFRAPGQLHRNIEPDVEPDVQRDGRRRERLQSRELRDHFIRADRKSDQPIDAGLIAACFAGESSIRVPCANAHAAQRGSLRICHQAGDAGRRRLRGGGHGSKHQRQSDRSVPERFHGAHSVTTAALRLTSFAQGGGLGCSGESAVGDLRGRCARRDLAD